MMNRENETVSTTQRLHDFDALRAAAMLLGITLHACSAYRGANGPVRDVSSDKTALFDEFFHAGHGFRMQLFFILSGFFTAMLHQRRGCGAMMKQRAIRIVVPLVIGIFTIVPVTRWLKIRLGSEDWIERRNVAVDGSIEIPWSGPFGHLWFLWFLTIFVAGYVLLVAVRLLVRSLTGWRGELPTWSVNVAVGVLLVTTWGCQYLMLSSRKNPYFGAPAPLTVSLDARSAAYYAAFFCFGIVMHSVQTSTGRPFVGTTGNRWMYVLPFSILIAFPLALDATYGEHRTALLVSAFLQAVYTWSMIYGVAGLFRRLMRKDNRRIRYVSDSAYWLYLMHPPLVLLGQSTMKDWPLSASVKFIGLNLVVMALLIVSYQIFVRYTPIGWTLNGRRTRPRPDTSIRTRLKATLG
ncbi:MAG: acyltransferase family protein [Acidimicrobiales bacterium]|nr:acyltransferase family protein [Acidimicrobiales bacterium]